MATEGTKTAVAAPALKQAPETAFLHEQIAALAFSLWEARGCPEGSPEEDWFSAEAQLNQEA